MQATFVTLAAKVSVRDTMKVRRLAMLLREMETSDILPGFKGRTKKKEEYTFGELIHELELKVLESM